MDLTYEELLAENDALKECVKTQAKTIDRLLNAYVLNIENEESEKTEKNCCINVNFDAFSTFLFV